MVKSSFSEIVGDFISLFYPRYCRGCLNSLAKGEDLICTECMLEMPRSYYHLEHNNAFYRKLRGRLPVEHVMALFKFTKQGRVQQVLHALKYKQQPELGTMLGRLYGQDLVNAGYRQEFDLIVPVPLHASRRIVRGYNQSEEFGKGLSDILSAPCDDSLVTRAAITSTQTRKTKLSRWENVSRVFEVVNNGMLVGKRVLLVDDVMTTGATLEACGHAILNAGCAQLSIACIAATQ